MPAYLYVCVPVCLACVPVCREEDVTETMYPRVGMDVGARQGGREGNKVDRVCDAMRQALVDMGESK